MTDIGLLVRSANPVPDDSQVLTDDAFEAVLLLAKQRSTDMDVREKPDLERQSGSKRTGWTVAAVTFGAAVAVIGTFALLSSRSATEQPPATTPTTVVTTTEADNFDALTQDAVRTTEAFLGARQRFDSDAALALVADDAIVSVGPADSKAALAPEMEWQEATGLVVEPDRCEVLTTTPQSDGAVAVRCTAVVTSPIAATQGDADGVVFSYEATVRDDAITSIELVDLGAYSTVVWEPFEGWVSQSRPESHSIMYLDGGSSVALSDESIALWRQYTTEYVNEQVHSEAFSVVTSFLDLRYRNVISDAQELLAADAVLDWGPGYTRENLPEGRGWEDATGIEFEPGTCVVLSASSDGENGEVVDFRCSVYVTSSIASAVGDSGVEDCVDLTVNGSLITRAELGSGCTGGFNFASRMFRPFETWLEDAHPELSFDVMLETLYSGALTGGDLDQWRSLTEEFVAAQRSG